jgi:hypothetical protein
MAEVNVYWLVHITDVEWMEYRKKIGKIPESHGFHEQAPL